MTLTDAGPASRLILGLLLLAGCGLVLWPFLPAILFSVAIAVVSWPIHRWLLHRLKGRRVIASLVSCLVVTVLVVTPIVLLMISLRDGAIWLLGVLNDWGDGQQPPLPDWISRLPMIGEQLQQRWQQLGSVGSGGGKLPSGLADPARRLALASVQALGYGLLQLLVAAALLYLLYRDGEALGLRTQAWAKRLGGPQGVELLGRAQATVKGVALGVMGAGLAQAAVATIGFAIAGVPNPFLLGALTFVLSLVPVGPPLIWGGATLWLVQQGQPGWAIFMAVYGLLGISTIDNVLKPLLISQSSRLPFALTLIGVIGGVIAFGVAGVLLGPLLLALALDFSSRLK